MLARADMWAEVIARLGLEPIGPSEDGVLYRLTTPECGLELHLRLLREPVTARIVVRAHRVDDPFVVVAAAVAPAPSRWKTGDPTFDEKVSILAGGRALLPRLGPAERQRLTALVAEYGAIVAGESASIEPVAAARLGDAKIAVPVIRDLMRLTTELATDPPVVELIGRWLDDDGAPMVASAVNRRVVELLPGIPEAQADAACALLLERGADAALPLLTVMPPYACVLSAWFKVGDPLDPRVAARVIEAWASGVPRPAARYLVWLLHRADPPATQVAERLGQTPGLLEDDGFVRELARAVVKDPPPAALRLLLQVKPRSPSVTVRVAKALALYSGASVDERLMDWLVLPSLKVRSAAASALAARAQVEIGGTARPEALEAYRRAAERSSELLLALLDRLPVPSTPWLVGIRPQSEPDAIALLRRLARGGADVDRALLFWLDRGTVQVRIEAARALGSAGSTRVVAQLRDRAGSWFSDGGVREACRAALDRIRERHGGVGSLALAGDPPTLPAADDDWDADIVGSVADLATAEVAREK